MFQAHQRDCGQIGLCEARSELACEDRDNKFSRLGLCFSLCRVNLVPRTGWLNYEYNDARDEPSRGLFRFASGSACGGYCDRALLDHLQKSGGAPGSLNPYAGSTSESRYALLGSTFETEARFNPVRRTSSRLIRSQGVAKSFPGRSSGRITVDSEATGEPTRYLTLSRLSRLKCGPSFRAWF